MDPMDKQAWDAQHKERRDNFKREMERLDRQEKQAIRWVIAVGIIALLLKAGVLFGIGYVVYLLLKYFGVI